MSCEPGEYAGSRTRSLLIAPSATNLWPSATRGQMGSLVKKRRKKMSKHKYRKRLRANRHKRKK